MFILLCLMVVRIGKISISVSISKKKANIEEISYRMKKLVSPIPKAGFPLGGILRAERNFSLSCDFSGGTN